MNNIKSIYSLREQEMRVDAGTTEQSLSSLVFTTPGTSWNDTFIEVSMPDSTGTRESRKLNLGKILDYIIAQLNKLADAQTTGDWLTREEAEKLFVLKAGDTMTGGLTIDNGTAVALKTVNGTIEAKTVNASSSVSTSSLTTSTAAVNSTLTVGSSSKDGSASFYGPLAVTGKSTLNGDIDNTAGNYSAKFKSVSATSIADSGNLTAGGTLEVSGASQLKGGATVTGNVSATGTLTAGNKLTISSGGADIAGNVSVTGTLASGGALTAGGKLTVSTGGAELTGNVSATGTLTAGNKLTISSGGAAITGDLKIKDVDSTPGKIIFGETSPYIQKKDSSIYMSSAQIGTVTIGSIDTTGSATVYGPLTVKGNITNQSDSSGAKYTATFQDIKTTSIQDSGNVTVGGTLAVTGSTDLNSGVSITGNSYLKSGKLVFGTNAEAHPYIENRSNETLYMSTATMGSATIGTFDGAGESRTVLTVKGDLNNGITNTKTTINRAVFLNEVDAPKFVSPYFILAGDSVNYPEKDCGIDNSSGFYQGSGVGNGNAQLTAQAACWS